jgi:peptidoglycan/LPS O-acetylase OafA/YrhL
MANKPATSFADGARTGAVEAQVKSVWAAGVEHCVSLNFSVAKVVAIFTVLLGHWFTPSILWIPVTFGLFVFGFSSAYFTSRIYGVDVDKRRFWTKKLERLGLRYWVILAFLAVVVALRGGTVFHWHTVAHFLGLSGVLNWLAIPNGSDLGAGLWFFTLLLLFYLVYPYLARAGLSKQRAWAIASVAAGVAIYLEDHVRVGHELWLTSLGFILGTMYGANEPALRASWAAGCAVLGCAVLLAAHAVGINGINTTLIAITSISLAVWLSKVPNRAPKASAQVAKLENYLLEIFLIHTYLFVHPTGKSVPDLAISIALVVAAAIAISQVANWLSSQVFDRQHPVHG